MTELLPIVSDAVIEADLSHEDKMIRGSQWLLNLIRRERAGGFHLLPRKALPPQTLIWTEHSRGPTWKPDGERADLAGIERRVAVHTERDLRAEAQRTYRDPCPKCGTRRDVGCRHYPRGW